MAKESKVFIDQGLIHRKWFRELDPIFKSAWLIISLDCDHAGAWSIDEERLSFLVGAPVNLDDFIGRVNSDGEERIKRLSGDKLFLPKYVRFQYGKLKEGYNPHKPAIKRLRDLGLFQGLPNPSLEDLTNPSQEPFLGRVQDKNKDKDKDQNQDQEKEGGCGGKPNDPRVGNLVRLDPVSCRACWDRGRLTAVGLTDGKPYAVRCTCPSGDSLRGNFVQWHPGLRAHYRLEVEPKEARGGR